jgi:hypothetical protein
MMKTGIVCRKERSVGSGKQQKFVYEYEIDTAAVEALLNVERQAAIECGQWSEKSELKVDGQMNHRAATLVAKFSLREPGADAGRDGRGGGKSHAGAATH